MSKSELRAFGARMTDAYLLKGGFVTRCAPQRKPRAKFGRDPHSVMPRWMAQTIALRP